MRLVGRMKQFGRVKGERIGRVEKSRSEIRREDELVR